MSPTKSMVIIGAGVAGLSAGCYARMNGYDATIIEMHTLPGGVCTSWRRGDYLFDHCLHWVIGSNKGNALYPIFEELGVAQAVQFYHTERFRRIEAGGKTLTVYTNLDRFEAELLRLFPAEARAIRKFIGLVRFYTGFKPPLDADFGQFGPSDMLKMLPYMPSFLRLKGITIEAFLARTFRDPALREMLFQMFPVRSLPALMAVMPLAYFHNHEGGYPLGGSLRLARALERRFLDLGGAIQYGQKVERILVEGCRAAGVALQNGEEVRADIVISACDGRSTLYGMLGGRHLTPRLRKMYENPSLWPPIISVSLGVNRDLTGEVEIQNFALDRPVRIADRMVDRLGFFHYCHDPAFAPRGKSVVEMQIETDYCYWRDLYADREKYGAEKERVLAACLDVLETRLPGIKSQVEAADVATPVTWERYTGNWRGSYEGWLPTVALFGRMLPRELPGLRDFYMTGQWVSPGGGVPMCMAQGRRLIKIIRQKEGGSFTAGVPQRFMSNHTPDERRPLS